MGGYAWVTLATNDSYSLGALVLAHSLKRVGTQQELVALITPGVTQSMRDKLSSVYNLVREVNILDSKDEENLRLIQRPELGVTFTKLHCWRLTQYEKCVFLDADTMVLQNCDELFEREELSAAPDVGWPDCFNSGVFVYRPSNETYDKLIQFALEKGSFDGGDQGLLNLYFADWATKDLSRHLPFIYNMCSTAVYSYLPAFKQFGANAKIIHFLAASKPWLQYFNTETRRVQAADNMKHLEVVLQQWWDIFCDLIHPNLTTDMAQNRSARDVTLLNTNQSSYTSVPNAPATPDQIDDDVWDPWDEYDRKQSLPILTNPVSVVTPCESHNTNACDIIASQNVPQQHSDTDTHPPQICDTILDQLPFVPEPVHCEVPVFESTTIPFDQPDPELVPEPPTYYDEYVENDPTPVIVELIPKLPIPPAVLRIECEATDPPIVCKDSHETTLHSPNEDKREQAGLAGAFAQLTLGAPRTAEQTALDDHLRRQGWEIGNIDYLGRDSFDNIWSKICQTLSGSAAATPQPAKEQTSPVIQPEEQLPPAEAPTAQEAQPAVCPLPSPPIAAPVPEPLPAAAAEPVIAATVAAAPSETVDASQAPPVATPEPASEPLVQAGPAVASPAAVPTTPEASPAAPTEVVAPAVTPQLPEEPITCPRPAAQIPAAAPQPQTPPQTPEAAPQIPPQTPAAAPQTPQQLAALQAQTPPQTPEAAPKPQTPPQAPAAPQPETQAAAPQPQTPPQTPAVVPQPQTLPQIPAAVPKGQTPAVATQTPSQTPAAAPQPQTPPQTPAAAPPQAPVVAPQSQTPPQTPAAAPQQPQQAIAAAPQPQTPPQTLGAAPQITAAAPKTQTPPQTPPVAQPAKPKGGKEEAPGSGGASSAASPTPPPRKGSGGGAKKQAKPKK